MNLCDLCKSVSFDELPPYPEDEYIATSTGLEHVQNLVRNRNVSRDATTPTVSHHVNNEDLRRAAAEGCELCLLIQGAADAILAELGGLEGDMKQYSYGPSTFNMWLTKRPDGGQGFWVLSEHVGGKVIMPVAAFGFTVAEDDSLARLARGRPVKQHPDTQTLQRLVQSNAACEHYHKCCQSTGPMPSRLIDVQSSKSGNTAKLVEVDAEVRQGYTALTHASESGITFQDAVLVTRTLGVQYLWVDSLCIPDNPREWERDSEQAGFVYTNTYLTDSATGSEKVTDGLLFTQPSQTSPQIPYKTSDDIAGTVVVSALPLAKEVIRSRYIKMEKEPISNGVWSFQERVLSPRIVHFASDQMYFKCLSHFVSEDGLLERLRYHTTVQKLPDGAATSNVTRAFQRMLEDDNVVGYPVVVMVSFDGIPNVGFRARSIHFTATVIKTQVSLLDDAKPFGRVSAASIELNAPLVPLRLLEKRGTKGPIYGRTDNGDEDSFYVNFDTIDSHDADSDGVLRNAELFALVMAETYYGECLDGECDIEGSYRGLIVTPVDASGDRFKRLGFILASSHTFGYGELSNSRKTITLV